MKSYTYPLWAKPLPIITKTSIHKQVAFTIFRDFNWGNLFHFWVIKSKLTKMKKLFSFVLMATFATTAQAKIWRVNNNVGISADATALPTLFDGTSSASNPEAANGDTIHVEPSATAYNSPNINKQVVIIGNGYLLSGTGSNTGLQENTLASRVGGFFFGSGSAGTRIIGIDLVNQSGFFGGHSGNVNITYEKCRFNQNIWFNFNANTTYTNITVRKCFIESLNSNIQATTTLNNFTLENCVQSGIFFDFPTSLGTNIVIRNNVFSAAAGINLQNAYVANNLFLTGTTVITFISCNVKNNIFTANQTGVTVGPLNTNGNNLINQAIATVVVNTGSNDGRFQLAAGSPAISGGVDIAGQKPNCGAFGGNDPYKLSGIPGIPTIYSLTVPTSIPVGSATMNVTLSTRNNN
jgi:hypothetical protein